MVGAFFVSRWLSPICAVAREVSRRSRGGYFSASIGDMIQVEPQTHRVSALEFATLAYGTSLGAACIRDHDECHTTDFDVKGPLTRIRKLKRPCPYRNESDAWRKWHWNWRIEMIYLKFSASCTKSISKRMPWL